MTEPTTRNLESTRGRILDAALNLFARKGYYDTRLDEIVDESSTSKRPCGNHLPLRPQHPVRPAPGAHALG